MSGYIMSNYADSAGGPFFWLRLVVTTLQEWEFAVSY